MKQKYINMKILDILNEAAIDYKENLLNKNIAFVYEDSKTGKISYIEVLCKDYHFQHLTGLKYKDTSKTFFNDCLNKKITFDKIINSNLDENQLKFSYLKLQVLKDAMSINKMAKRIGDYNYSKRTIEIEKVVGTASLCLGFSNLMRSRRRK